MSPKFNSGDVVKLKSGGPKMTVREYSGNKVICNWQDDKKKAYQEEYLEEQLEKYVSPAVGASSSNRRVIY